MFILVFIITLLFLVVIHELGHFLAAKKFGVKVLEFGFGIPPRIWGKKWGETLVSINWLPFGGFVRLLGEDETDKKVLEDKRSLAHQSVGKRMIIVIAGVAINLIFAWILFYIVLAAQGFKTQLPLLSEHTFIGVEQKNEKIVLVSEVAEDSPAASAGLQVGERITAFNGQVITDRDQLIEATKAQAGQKVQLTLTDIQGENVRTIEVEPRVNPPAGQGALGVALGAFEVANLDYQQPWQKILAGPIHSINLADYSSKIFANTIGSSFAKKDFSAVSQNVAGPVGITSIVKQILDIKNPLIPYLDFVAALSLNLALVNILPFPGLDGGRFFFYIIEAITKKKVNPKVESVAHTVGLVVLLGLAFVITVSDLKKIFF